MDYFVVFKQYFSWFCDCCSLLNDCAWIMFTWGYYCNFNKIGDL